MRNTDLTNEQLEPIAPRRGNHFSSRSDSAATAADPAGNAAGVSAGSAAPQPSARRAASPSETAAYASAYFQSAQRKAPQTAPAARGTSTAASGYTPTAPSAGRAAASQAQPAAQAPRPQQAAQPVQAARASQTPLPSSGGNGGGRGTGHNTHHSSYYNQQPPRKRGRGKLVAGIIGAIFAIIVAVGGGCGFFMLQDYRAITAQVPTLMEEAGTLKDSVMAGDGETVRNTAAEIAGQVSDIHNRLEGIPWKLASFVPVVGSDVSTVRTVVAEADRLCQYALIPACDSLGDLNLSNLMTDGAINVGLLQSLADTLQSVAPVVEQSAETIADLPEPNIGKVREVVTKVQGVFEKANSAVTAINEIAPYLPQMLGADGVRNYLLIAQTNSEVRSTGGLPGSMGVLSIANGNISLGEFEPGAALHYYDTPSFGVTDEEVSLFSGVGVVPTSTTLIPDFQRAASILCQIWCDQKGGTLDGAIAIDPVFLQHLLALTGGFTAADGTVVNGDNAARLLLHDAYQNMETSQTDTFFSSVADMAFDNVLGNLSNINLGSLGQTITDAIDNRQVQVYMTNPDEEDAMVQLGCSGNLNSDETAPEVGIYLNDATWSKISWYLSVDTQIGEGTHNADGTTTYHVTTTLKNNLSPNEASTLVEYITGYNPSKRDVTDMLDIVYIFAPAGGSISNMTYTDDSGNTAAISEATYNGRQFFTNTAQFLGEKQVTYTYDVTVSANATEPLGVDTTPTAQSVAGWQ